MGTRIYVGNLPFSATDDQLAQTFGAYGNVVDARVITDRATGQGKGFGFVEMGTEDEARNAIAQLNGTMMDGRALRVNEAQPRPDRPRGGGGGGGYGGGGYGGGSRGGGYGSRRDDDSRGSRW